MLTVERIDLVFLEIRNCLQSIVESVCSIITHRVQRHQIRYVERISIFIVLYVVIEPHLLLLVPQNVIDRSLIVLSDFGVAPDFLQRERGGK